MEVIHPISKCNEAKFYYYDYLNNLRSDIPIGISDHIDKCDVCQHEIGILGQIIDRNKDSHNNTRQINAIINASLRLHFAFENAMVTCQTVKPFLPSLADPLFKIRIPTPITVHIDKCDKCRKDLDDIQGLNLNNKQLSILGQIFAQQKPEKELCLKAQEFIPRIVALSLNKTTSEYLKHICTCPDCRAELYRQRELVLRGLQKSGITEESFDCSSVQPTDIFDYCLPYNINIEDEQYAEFRTPFTFHVSACAICLSKIQNLHKTISEIQRRPDSSITTCYKLISGQKAPVSNTDFVVRTAEKNIYADWPIDVTIDDSSQRNSVKKSTRPGPKFRKNTCLRKVAKFFSAAAVILMLLILYFSTPAAKAIDLNQIYKALSKLHNIHFASYTPDKNIPANEKWISAELNIVLVKATSRITFWDIGSKQRKLIDLTSDNTQPVQVDYEDWNAMKNIITPPWELLPFNDISEAPRDSEVQWQKIDKQTPAIAMTGKVDAPMENAEIYELTWKEQTPAGTVIFKKWRGYIDNNTKLLRRAEFWQKSDVAEQYELKITQKIEYPTAAEIKKQIKESGF